MEPRAHPFEQDPALRPTVRRVRTAMAVQPPVQLDRRVYDATLIEFDRALRALDGALEQALAAEGTPLPDPLNDQIFLDTAHRLPARAPTRPVLARIGAAAVLAASLLLAAGLVIWTAAWGGPGAGDTAVVDAAPQPGGAHETAGPTDPVRGAPTSPGTSAAAEAAPVEADVEDLMREIERVLIEPNPLEAQLTALGAELDHLAMALENEGAERTSGESTVELQDELDLMESGIDAF